MKIGSCLAMVSLIGASAFAADVNGKWKAEMPGRGGQTQEMTFEFKAEGGKITSCTASTQRGEQPLSDCKLKGDEISFTRQFGREGKSMKIIYKGKVSDNEIKFTMEPEGGGGGGRAREFVAKKVS